MQTAKRDRLTMGEKDGGTGDRRLGQILLEREYLKPFIHFMGRIIINISCNAAREMG